MSENISNRREFLRDCSYAGLGGAIGAGVSCPSDVSKVQKSVAMAFGGICGATLAIFGVIVRHHDAKEEEQIQAILSEFDESSKGG